MLRELELYEACPLCDSREIADLRTADCSGHAMYKPQLSAQMDWRACRECTHVFRSGYYTPEACEIVFSATHDFQQVGHDLEQQRFVAARMVEKVARYRSSGDWLDVGFGNGALLLTAQEFGFTPVGIDLRPDSAAAMQAAGVEAWCTDIAGLDFPGRFSVISLADVLEHEPFPRNALVHARTLLGEGGVLFASMPNSEAPVWRWLDAQGANPYWGELEHCHNFSRTRLYALLEEAGFEPVHYGVSERYRACMEVIAIKAA